MGFINVARHLEEWNMSYTYPNNTSFRFLWHLSIFLPDCRLRSEAGPWSLSLGNELLLTQLWLLKGRCVHALAGHLTIQKQVSGEPQSPFLSFQPRRVKLLLPVICVASKNQTKVIFCSWGFAFSILCDDLLWHQDKRIPGITILMYLLASKEALLPCPISIPSAEQDPLCFLWFIAGEGKENRRQLQLGRSGVKHEDMQPWMPPATDATRGHRNHHLSSHIRMNQASSSNFIPF